MVDRLTVLLSVICVLSVSVSQQPVSDCVPLSPPDAVHSHPTCSLVLPSSDLAVLSSNGEGR